MYLNEAIKRINAIKWDIVGTKCSKAEADLGYEYLRRLAKFFKEESIGTMPPMIANIAKLIGDIDEEIAISDYCNLEAVEFLDERVYTRNILQYYIQLARYADKNSNAIKYLNVYEPLIKVLERGGLFILKPRELEIVKAAYYPLGDWYERFVAKKPIDIDEL